MRNEFRDLLRGHWRHRRDLVVDELRGLEAGLNALPDTPESEDVLATIRSVAAELRTNLERVEGFLGVSKLTRL
ncbi:MAG: hypothetical protein HC869_07320 [Rhodospirillales bacterium]|nr:hypothetical protein [Rhodospirillales bacterium]